MAGLVEAGGRGRSVTEFSEAGELDDGGVYWWLEACCSLSLSRRDGAHPKYRVVVAREERRFLQSPWWSFSEFDKARTILETFLTPAKECPFPAHYTKSRFGSKLNARELAQRTVGLENYLISALASASANGHPSDALTEAECGVLASALSLAEVSAPPADDDGGAARRRNSSFASADGGDFAATTRRRTTIGSAATTGLGGATDSSAGLFFAPAPKRPSSYSGAPAKAKRDNRFSARFSLSAFARDQTSNVAAATVAALPLGPAGIGFKDDVWPPTVERVDAALNAALRGRLNVGDVVTIFAVNERGKVTETDCEFLCGDQLELLLAADDGSANRILHVCPARTS